MFQRVLAVVTSPLDVRYLSLVLPLVGWGLAWSVHGLYKKYREQYVPGAHVAHGLHNAESAKRQPLAEVRSR